MDPSLDKAELDEREPHNEQKQDDRLRARETELKVLERVQVDAVHEDPRRIHRTTTCEQMDLCKSL